ncbi:hypothetical protein BKA69DRAFT_1126178 [Paraphysoderma sedebokerense]|nr:hypothetical protein BKA69DRAFT_1126178 [Paraphysoderma sedebokerense]
MAPQPPQVLDITTKESGVEDFASYCYKFYQDGQSDKPKLQFDNDYTFPINHTSTVTSTIYNAYRHERVVICERLIAKLNLDDDLKSKLDKLFEREFPYVAGDKMHSSKSGFLFFFVDKNRKRLYQVRFSGKIFEDGKGKFQVACHVTSHYLPWTDAESTSELDRTQLLDAFLSSFTQLNIGPTETKG